MSVRKYRMYLVMVILAVLLIGTVSYLLFAEQEKDYKEGTLVQNEWMLEEELA